MARDITDSVVLLAGVGFDYEDVLYNWPYDRFKVFTKAAKRRELEQRMSFVTDVASAIGGAMGGKGLPGYVKDMKDVLEYDL